MSKVKKVLNAKPANKENKKDFAFGKLNYILIGISFAVIIIGFILMTGPGTTEETGFQPDIFSTRRIVIAPTVCLAGFMFIIYAVLKTPKNKEANETVNTQE